MCKISQPPERSACKEACLTYLNEPEGKLDVHASEAPRNEHVVVLSYFA